MRLHLFHETRLIATLPGATARPEPYYTLDDGLVVQAISYMTVTHSDGTPGLDVQVVPVVPPRAPATHTADKARPARRGHRA